MNSNGRNNNNFMALSMQIKQMNEVIQQLLLQRELDKNKIVSLEYNSNLMQNSMIMMNQNNQSLKMQILNI